MNQLLEEKVHGRERKKKKGKNPKQNNKTQIAKYQSDLHDQKGVLMTCTTSEDISARCPAEALSVTNGDLMPI